MKAHIGLVGCGNWGRYILRDLKTLGCNVSVVAVSAQGRLNAREFGADRILSAATEFDGEVDGFVVATPTVCHADTVFSLLQYQRPVFVEKPLTNDPESAQGLVDAAGDRIFVMDKWRYHPGIEALRDLVVSGELGGVESIRTARLGWSNPHRDVDSAWILLPHDLSIVLEILGHIPDPVFALPEYAKARLTGLLGVLRGSASVVSVVSEKSVVTVRSVAVNFRDGAAVLEDSYAEWIQIRRVKGAISESSDPIERRRVSGELPLQRELQAFLHYLQGGPAPKSSAREGARVVEVISRLRHLANLES